MNSLLSRDAREKKTKKKKRAERRNRDKSTGDASLSSSPEVVAFFVERKYRGFIEDFRESLLLCSFHHRRFHREDPIFPIPKGQHQRLLRRFVYREEEEDTNAADVQTNDPAAKHHHRPDARRRCARSRRRKQR